MVESDFKMILGIAFVISWRVFFASVAIWIVRRRREEKRGTKRREEQRERGGKERRTERERNVNQSINYRIAQITIEI
ncbi:hypothetical protein BOTNAR_0184g00080 [Botryotinia narcissicola]|uniref:Uncharacterized protein n=1 Tax=Botryotinia narcissicola TaxID=278944 RepID=A0A4Z1IAI4_9HELO|nr:hypothetical protein BOTNAR_0184g00080 [Botryotinia narcissicola]